MQADTSQRTIQRIASESSRADLAPLVGAQAGGHLREVLARVLPEEKDAGSGLYLLLDDLSGATLVAGWALSRWQRDWLKAARQGLSGRARKGMEGVCIGFSPGSSALDSSGMAHGGPNTSPVVPLPNPADPDGWHPMPDDTGKVSMRRARRIDVWSDEVIHVDAMFQDSATDPGGGRVAIHEYQVSATADRGTGELLSLSADPRTLPYSECPGAVANIQSLKGVPLRELRTVVLFQLRKTRGCTHLNDVLRSLAEVPQLAAAAARINP